MEGAQGSQPLTSNDGSAQSPNCGTPRFLSTFHFQLGNLAPQKPNASAAGFKPSLEPRRPIMSTSTLITDSDPVVWNAAPPRGIGAMGGVPRRRNQDRERRHWGIDTDWGARKKNWDGPLPRSYRLSTIDCSAAAACRHELPHNRAVLAVVANSAKLQQPIGCRMRRRAGQERKLDPARLQQDPPGHPSRRKSRAPAGLQPS